MTIVARLLSLFAMVAIAGSCATETANLKGVDVPADPNEYAELNVRMAAEYMKKGDNDIALRRLQTALEYDPRYAAAHSTLGLLYARLNQFDKAEKHFKESLRIAADDPDALNNYGQYLCSRGHYQDGIELFAQAVQNPLYRNPEITYANSGMCALGVDLDLAEKNLRRALQIDPKLSPALFQMSKLSYQKQRFLQARGYLQRYLEVADHSAQSLWLGIRIERELDDQDTVASYGLALKANYPDSEETRLLFKSEE